MVKIKKKTDDETKSLQSLVQDLFFVLILYDLVLRSSRCVHWQQASRLVHEVHDVAARHGKGLVAGRI